MQSHFRIVSPKALSVICAFAFAAGVIAPSAHADQWDKRTVLTVNQPIQVRETLLNPGTYVLRLLDSDSNRHIVQIYSGDESRVIDTVQAIPGYRAQPTDKTQFTFWETPNGTARALRAWFYPGQTIGQEFPYPKEPRQLAMLTTPAALVRPAAAAQTPAPQPAAANPATAERPETQPVEVAANSAAPEPAASPEPAPAPAAEPAPPAAQGAQGEPAQPAKEPTQLPKTASPYPLIGLCGLCCICLGGLMGRLRKAYSR